MMVFVNDLAGVSDIPAWMKHVAADADSMTFVDVVFPAFLFIVGMANSTCSSKPTCQKSRSPSLLETCGNAHIWLAGARGLHGQCCRNEF